MVFLQHFFYNRKAVNIIYGTNNFRNYLSHLFLFKYCWSAFHLLNTFQIRIEHAGFFNPLFQKKGALWTNGLIEYYWQRSQNAPGSLLISKPAKYLKGESLRGTVLKLCWLFSTSSNDWQRFCGRLTYFVHWH